MRETRWDEYDFEGKAEVSHDGRDVILGRWSVKHPAQTLREVARDEPEYLRWMLRADDPPFPEDLCTAIAEVLGE